MPGVRVSAGRVLEGWVARAAEALARSGLPADAPEVLRVASGLGWRTQRVLCVAREARMRDELQRTFGAHARTLGAITREAHDLAAQTLLEEALVPRMTDGDVDRVLRVRGLVRAPTVVTWATTGPRGLLLRALARAVTPVTVVAFRARGEGSPARRAAEDSLPVTWEDDPERLSAWVARGCVVAGAWDDRAWGRWVRAPLLGRTALLPAPLLDAAAGPGLVHATLVRERDKRWVLTFRPPGQADAAAFAAHEAEPFLRAHPGHWAGSLARAALPDAAAPLFEG